MTENNENVERIELKFCENSKFSEWSIDGHPADHNSPGDRIQVFKGIMNTVFNQFEDVERKNLHEAKSEKVLAIVLDSLAKAETANNRGIVLRNGFYWFEINLKKNMCEEVTKENINQLILDKSKSERYNGFSDIDAILYERKVGAFYMTVCKLWEKRPNLKIVIDTDEIEPAITISW